MEEEKRDPISFFTDPLLLSYITPYLSLPQKLRLSQLSKQIRFIIEHYFRIFLQENRLHIIPHKSAIHQMRFYFDRCLRIFKTQREHEGKEDPKGGKGIEIVEDTKLSSKLHNTVENPFKFSVIMYFEVGMVYSGFIDNQNKAYIFRTQSLVSEQKEDKLEYAIEANVEGMRCKGEKLLLLRVGGEVMLWETDKKSQQICQKKSTLFWTMQLPVLSIYSSFNYAVFLLANPYTQKEIVMKHIFGYDYNLQNVNGNESEEEHDNLAVAMGHQTNCYYLLHLRAEKTISIAVGHKQVYYLNQHHECMIIEFDEVNEGTKELNGKIYHPLAKKHIVKVSSGYNFFLALEKKVEFIQQWTTEQVILWMRGIGFGDFAKIAMAEKIDGSKLKNIERKYMENVLGINKLNMQQKFMLCIEEVIQGKNEYEQLWVWGKNDWGQLGVAHANYIAQPHRIKMDFLKENDKVDSIFCGWFQTYIRTHRGKIYETCFTSERKKKKVMEEKEVTFSDEQERKREEEGFKYKKQKRKRTEDLGEAKKTKNRKRFEEQARWIQSHSGKAFFVEAFKDFVFYVQCPGQNKFQPTKQRKLRTSKAIIDRITWDDSLNKSQFKIGIIDKDMGTIEISLYQIQSFDYKQSSIRYVKRNNKVVWDRDSKIDDL